jgi:hypothetical protein
MDIHEVREHIEHAAEGHEHHASERSGKRVALIIAVLAALLAVTELGENSSQNEYNALNVQSNDVWSFYQAKTIRMSMADGTLQVLNSLEDLPMSPDHKAALDKSIGALTAEARRMDSDPQTGEGRKELQVKARALEAERDAKLNAYHAFEYGAAALQLGVVLASAGLLTGAGWLISIAIGLGGVALGLDGVGWFLPELMRFIH